MEAKPTEKVEAPEVEAAKIEDDAAVVEEELAPKPVKKKLLLPVETRIQKRESACEESMQPTHHQSSCQCWPRCFLWNSTQHNENLTEKCDTPSCPRCPSPESFLFFI